MSAIFSIHGVRARVESSDAAVLGELARDFSGPAEAGPAHVSLSLARGGRPGLGGLAWRWRGCRFRDSGATRRLDYGGGTGALWDYSREAGEVWSPDPALLHELGYLFLHSRVGAALDERGLHRVHALGFAWRGRGILLLLPEGGGKTTLALHLAHRPEFALLSDDLPLLHGGDLAGFPQRLSLRDSPPFPVAGDALRSFRRRRHGTKTLLDESAYPGRRAARAPLDTIIVGTRSAGGPSLRPCSAARAGAALADAMVLGRGLPQVAELMAPGGVGEAASLARTALARAARARSAVARARLARFALGDGPAAAAALLADFLER